MLCGFMVFKSDFQLGQFNRKDNRHCCKTCVEKKKAAGTPFECTSCHLRKSEAAFAMKDSRQFFWSHRVCNDCDEKRICRCVWDGQVRFDEKKAIMKNVFTWWQQKTNSCLDHRLVDYEDGLAFTETMEDLECTLKYTDTDEL